MMMRGACNQQSTSDWCVLRVKGSKIVTASAAYTAAVLRRSHAGVQGQPEDTARSDVTPSSEGCSSSKCCDADRSGYYMGGWTAPGSAHGYKGVHITLPPQLRHDLRGRVQRLHTTPDSTSKQTAFFQMGLTAEARAQTQQAWVGGAPWSGNSG